ncbi:replication-associated protein [Sewage-associated circular DNA virus-14]|nr:replication-associated protein [Sewage-associated circular DNA virus-14]
MEVPPPAYSPPPAAVSAEVVPRPFRLAGKAIFLTWPQNDVSKEDLMAKIVALWEAKLSWAVVAEESHKSGEPHVHAIVQFAERLDLKNANPVLDALTGKHGNYQSVKSAKKVLRYVCKDGQYITHGEVPDFSEKPKLQDWAAKLIIEEQKTYRDLVREQPGFSMMQKRKLEEFIGWNKRQKLADSLLPWRVLTPKPSASPVHVALWTFLRENVLVPRTPRQAQLWLCGLPGVGKTRFLAYLRARLRVYDMPRSEDFYDEYEDGCFDLVVLDEYKAHKKIQFLNAWADGQPLPLRQKGSQLTKTDNLPLIIVSNYSIEEVYRPGVGRDALVDRFTQVFVDTAFVIDDPEHVE